MNQIQKKRIRFYIIYFFMVLGLIIATVYIKNHYESSSSNLLSASMNDTIVKDTNDVKISKISRENNTYYEVNDYERDLNYSWEFLNNNSDELTTDNNLRLSINDINNNSNIINERVDQNKLIVSFDYHGTLPTTAIVSIDVSKEYQDGEELYLYYYNPEKDDMEYTNNKVTVEGGKVSFPIEHCSDYFLTASIVSDALNNPSSINLSYILLGIGVVVFIIVAIILIHFKDDDN